MSRRRHPHSAVRLSVWVVATCGLAASAGFGCSRPGGPFQVTQSEFPAPDAGTISTPIAVMEAPPVCTPAKSSTPLPALTTVAGAGNAGGMTSQNVYRTSDLFAFFDSVCGGCHVTAPDGNFHVSETTFPMLVTKDVYSIITSDIPGVFMPPVEANGVPFSQRQPDDPVFQLASLLKVWLQAGSPLSDFVLPDQGGATGSAGYAMSATLGAQLTNIGSCVPNRPMVGSDQSTMDQLDAFFAAATALPSTLDQTDLVSLDSAVLAQSGVISYAPTYPLWSDDAGKMRYLRVPRGQSIAFDKQTQKFSIPANTRFYKTFLKQIVDGNGNSTYRKIETRLIVSRPDTTNPDGSAQQNALFGTYIWNKDETQAQLSNHPLRDGQPFADQIFPYILDDQKDAKIVATNPPNLEAAEQAAGIVRHYALPGSERCIQCHMGSPSQDFILGFTPLQVARRANGAGGVYEPATGDELTQLQRFIDYGLITGVGSAQDILPLERSEGSRTPRNQEELAAQAYMVGNCAHCHNARGYPSVRQPELKDVLVFLPGTGPHEGIFQFPLEWYSPVRFRGLNQNIRIPYVTPSLYDLADDTATGKTFCPQGDGGLCGDSDIPSFVLAPWRSLIFRNTDTPYDYFDDFSPFPHMPLNTSGYDCRVASLMADWMVSIPSTLKNPQNPQAALPGSPNANLDEQPYQEVLPTDPGYPAAAGAAQARLAQYHTSGYRYRFCPTSYKADIVDPVIADQVARNLTVQEDVGSGLFDSTGKMIMPVITPISPDYIALDNTDPAGDWYPRRPDWATALVDPWTMTTADSGVDAVVADAVSNGMSADDAEDFGNVLTALQGVTLTDATRSVLTQPVPFGLWDTSNASCNFSTVPNAGSFTGQSRPTWMDVAQPADSAPVFVESAGAAIFTTICFNCHGINADSKGLLADEISALTGGDARVANFRDGLFGPLTNPGGNRAETFGAAASTLTPPITADDLASRYMAFMALGGTEKHLPMDVLTEVSLTPVLGKVRGGHMNMQGTPDMLRLGLQLCEQIQSSDVSAQDILLANFVTSGRIPWSDLTGLVDTNGDAELWLRLCSLNNRPIVHTTLLGTSSGVWDANTKATDLVVRAAYLFWATGPNGEDWYGANPVMDQAGNLQTGVKVNDGNQYPICVPKPANANQLQFATQALAALKVKNQNAIPFCPDKSPDGSNFLDPSHQVKVTGPANALDYVGARQWAARGAINGALAVFLYLDQIEKDPSKRQPLYTQCNLIGTGQ